MTAYRPASPLVSDSAIPAPIQSSAGFSVRFVNGTIATVWDGDPPDRSASCRANTGIVDASTAHATTTEPAIGVGLSIQYGINFIILRLRHRSNAAGLSPGAARRSSRIR